MRHRNMYNLTGLPGWMRFGFSPGWVGTSPTGLGPCAQFLMSGHWPTPQMQAAWQAGPTAWGPPAMGAASATPGFGPAPGARQPPQPTPTDEKQWLENQAHVLQQQLDQINSRLGELAGPEPTQ